MSGTGWVNRHAKGSVRAALAFVRGFRRGLSRRSPDDIAGGDLPHLYREMHAKALFPGITWRGMFETLSAAIPELEQRTIVDFGCGPYGGLAERLGKRVISYDPYVDAYATPPWDKHFDVLFSSDVLEHLPQPDIDAFASQVMKCRPEFIFLNISTRAAHKTFSNGVNVHLTVQPIRWWRSTLGAVWDSAYSCQVLRTERDECTLLYRRRDASSTRPG